MSFTFNWPRFSDQFHHDAIQMLNTALNKGNKPPIIADKIEVVELEMGTQPPELEIRDIGDLTVDQFRGIFRLTYSGDAHLVLKTKVQANPLNHKQPDIHLMAGSRGMLAAQQPLVVPMLLRLSHFRLSSYVVLVVSKQKGITLVFKTDPLQNVDINSTFDSIAVIQKFIQREIEGQLRQMFREDLPGIIHRLSQQWVKAKVEAPYLDKGQPPATPSRHQPFETMSTPDLTGAGVGLHPHLARAHSLGTPSIKRPRSIAGDSVAGHSRRANATKSAGANSTSPQTLSPDPASHGEHENFDPTYGLRPEGLPTKSGFKGFSSLFTPNKGLADLTEEPNSDEDDIYEDDGASTSFDVVEWEDTVPDISPPPSVYAERGNTPEYETIPAVGGGMITRPRVLHSQSTIQPPPGIAPRLSHSSSRSQGSIRSGAITPSILTRHHSGSSYLPDPYSTHDPSRTAPFYHASRPRTPDSVASSTSGEHYSHPMTHHTRPPDLHSSSHPTHLHSHSDDLDSNNPIYIRRPRSERRLSVSSDASHLTATTTTSLLYPNTTTDPIATPSTSPINNSTLSSSYPYPSEPNPKITLRPSLNNNSIHQLSSLSHSNHTLSPYTRSLSHFTVRSVPPRSWASSTTGVVGHGITSTGPGGERQPVKARRKRIFRLGGKKPTDPSPPTTSVTPTSTTLDPGSADFNTHFAFGPDGVERPRRTGTEAGSRAHQLHQYQFVPSEFDAEDMDRYF
ncbi:hypothetical protein P691DRAFT_700310, partial [Macrolepiota fuliginosa MF-IS2]